MTKTRKKSFTYTNTTGQAYLFAAQKKGNIHTAYYLLLNDNEDKKFPILTSKILDELLKGKLTTYDKVVIYAAANWINKEKLEKYKIKFMQIPYQLPISKYESLYLTAWCFASQDKISEALKYIYKAYQIISRAVYTFSYSNLADETIYKLETVQKFKEHLEEVHEKIIESKKKITN
jgi:hypothetical protein